MQCAMVKYLLIISVLFSGVTFGQKNTQNIRGIVTDKLSQTPLTGVSVQITALNKGANTDSLGRYTISNIPPDRYQVDISYLGYKNITIPNVVVTSGKEVILDIAMEESFDQLKEIVIKASNKGGTINKLASVSARTFSMEEVNRYAGGRSDPARLPPILQG